MKHSADHRNHPGRIIGLDVPQPSADITDRSAWHFIEVRPVRNGWYEVRYWSETMRGWSCSVMRWWDGIAWRFSPHHDACDLGGHPRDQWRGRNRPD